MTAEPIHEAKPWREWAPAWVSAAVIFMVAVGNYAVTDWRVSAVEQRVLKIEQDRDQGVKDVNVWRRTIEAEIASQTTSTKDISERLTRIEDKLDRLVESQLRR